jgi:spermidine synthase
LVALIVFTRVLPALWFEASLDNYFGGDGYNGGFGEDNGIREWAKIGMVYVAVPLGLMGLPVLFMGASFPFVQALVADRVDTLGRRTGLLLFTNICGNVAGTLLVGFVLLDHLGTAGTYRLLALVLGIAGVGAALLTTTPRRRNIQLAGVIASLLLLVAMAPSNQQLWAFLHGVEPDELDVAEGHSCAAALRYRGDEAMMTINGSSQNPHPFDDFHVLIGLMPLLSHENPERALSIGMGMGSTTFGMLQDPRVDSVITVELCGEQYGLLHGLADDGRTDFQRMFNDPRYEARTGDGRKFLLADDDRYDVITVDTLRATSAFSGSLYSKEFYELVDERLDDDGIMAQWVPSGRVVNTAAQVFPHMIALTVPSYGNSTFFLASRQPIDLDPDVLSDRFADVPGEAFSLPQRTGLHGILIDGVRRCINDGTAASDLPSDSYNRDLRPLDEYFINNSRSIPELVAC